MTLAAHSFAELFPLIEGTEFEAFASDLKANGQRDKIVLLDGLILDGRNRYRAAQLHGLPAALGNADCFRDFDRVIEGDPLDFVLSKNLARRHLNESQRAMVAARLANLPAHRPADKSANLPTSQPRAAGQLNVSERLVRSAKKVQDKGSPALQHAVDIGKLAASAAAQAADLSEIQQDEIAAKAEAGQANVVRTVIKQGLRNNREAELGQKLQALPDRLYGVILADPEWEFTVFSKITGMDRAPDQHYPTSTTQEIAARDVQKIAAKDAMLCLWITDLARGIRIMELWGFAYKSYFVWVKDIVPVQRDGAPERLYMQCGPPSMGYWNRDRDEVLLIGTRGDFVAPAMGTQPESVIFAARPKIEGTKRGKHSAKPDDIHRWIEANWPNLPKIELNARAARPGWDVWGNEAPADEIPKPATEAAAAAGEELPASMRSDGDTFLAGGAEAGEKRLAPEPAPQTSATGVTGGESAATELTPAADILARGPRWREQFAEPLDKVEVAAPAVMEIPAFLLPVQPQKGGAR